jgi:uncharacterized protein (TIGR02452 family)
MGLYRFYQNNTDTSKGASMSNHITILKEILNETLKICDNGSYCYDGNNIGLALNKDDMQQAIVFTDEQIKTLVDNFACKNCENNTAFEVVNTTSYQAAKELHSQNDDVLVLNFANPVHPGGGVYLGATAQEEDLCRKSTLLKSLESKNAKAYYDFHRKLNSPLSSDCMILSPKVEVFRNSDNTLSYEPFVVSVLTCAAPIMSNAVRNMGAGNYEQLLYQRIKGMLCLASTQNYKSLVLGAWGCGAFGNDAEIVAKLFRRAFDEMNSPFDNVVMAVLDKSKLKYNYKKFKKYFAS